MARRRVDLHHVLAVELYPTKARAAASPPKDTEQTFRCRKVLNHLFSCETYVESFSPLSLSEVAVDLLMFQEKNFGRGCAERMLGMMVPISCFYDFSENGGFGTIVTQGKGEMSPSVVKTNF